MRALFLGDIFATTGREAVIKTVPVLRDRWKLDFVVANAEHASDGMGTLEKHAEALFSAGVDVLTSGNHIFDKREIIPYIEQQPRLLRPLNHPKGTPGKGYGVFKARNGEEVAVVSLLGRVFVKPILNNPFEAMEDILPHLSGVRTIFVDFHAEATSEKMLFAHAFDGRVTGVFGSHTHVPTADLQFFSKGTLYLSDMGMCGDYDSSIGYKYEELFHRMHKGYASDKLEVADGPATLCGVFIETDVMGKVISARTVRIGGNLLERTDEI